MIRIIRSCFARVVQLGGLVWSVSVKSEQNKKIDSFCLKWWAFAAGLIIAIGPVNEATLASDSQSESVVYQVTYSDRRIVNLPSPPRTNKGILLVTKISTTRSALPGYETISTGNTPVEELNPQRTVEKQMWWDGSAWVSENKPGPRSSTPQLHKPEGIMAVRVQNVLHWVMLSGNQITIAQARLRAAKKNSDITLALRDLEQARHAQQQAILAVGELQAILLRGGVSTGATPQPLRNVPPASTSTATLSTAPNGYPPNQPVLKSRVSVGGYLGNWNAGGSEWGWPMGGAVDIYQETPNPDYDTGPRVIIREQK